MADINRIKQRQRTQTKQFAIEPTNLLDLTENGVPSVLIMSKTTINNSSIVSEATELKNAARKSPWTDDRKGHVFANKSDKTTADKDPFTELKKYINSLSKG